MDGVETVVSVEKAIQNNNFHSAGVPVVLGSNLDEGSTFMCVGDRTMALAIANPISLVHPDSLDRQTDTHD